jgi:hypothetical protein
MTPQVAAPRARRTDPGTSHAAAQRSLQFAESHASRILLALQYGFLNAEEIGEAAGLTVVQVDRRTIELQRAGLIRVRRINGVDLVRNGMRVWEAV